MRDMNEYMVRPGLGNVGSYQVSCVPWSSSSLAIPGSSSTPFEISFYNVTKFITVRNTRLVTDASTPLRVGFSSLGVQGSNYFVLLNGESFSADFKVSRLYLLGDTTSPTSASVIAGLTGIESNKLVTNWTGSEGVG